MTKVRYNETIGANASSKATSIAGKLGEAKGMASSFLGSAESTISEKLSKLKEKQRSAKQLVNSYNQQLSAASEETDTSSIKEKLKDANDKYQKYSRNITAIESSATVIRTNVSRIIDNYIAKGIEYFNKFPGAISKIESAITNYNSTYGKVDFVDADGNSLGTIQIVDNANGGEVQQLTFTVTDADGNEHTYTISELLNAFYTYQGMTMSSLVQGAVLAEALGIDYTDEYRKQIMASTNSLINFASGANLFGLATSNDINDTAAAVGVDITNLNDNLLSGLSDEEREKYGDALANLANGTLSDGTKLAAGILGAYALTGFVNANSGTDTWQSAEKPTVGSEQELPDDTGSNNLQDQGGNTNNGGPTGPSDSGNPSNTASRAGGSTKTEKPTERKPTKKTEKATTKKPETTTEKSSESTTETPTENATPGTVTPTNGTTIPLTSPTDASTLPTEIKPEIEKDYDALARAKYEEQGAEAISEHRAKLTEEANQLFDAEDKTALKEKLKGYGYSDEDIETIIQDRNLTVNAIISGDQKQELTKIANELAAADKIENFNTKYDDSVNVTSLTDGTATQLMANRSADKGIQTAEKELAKAETNYTTKVETASAAIAAVTAAKTELDEVVNSIGGEIKSTATQWDKTTLEKYNKEVETLYNQTVDNIGNKASNWTSEDWEKVSAAKSNKETELAYNKGKDLTTWTTAQKDKYESSINDIKSSYTKKYGDDTSKWSSDVKEAYKKATDKVYKTKAVEIGKTKLDSNDRKIINEAETNMKNTIIKQKGGQSNWTEAEKQEYNKKIEELKNKYSASTSTKVGESSWSDEQAKKYNAAMDKYNKAVESAQKAVEDANTAKATYLEKKQGVADAEKEFYDNIASANKKTEEESRLKTDEANNAITVDNDKLTGNLDVGSSITFDENGATISTSPITANDGSTSNNVVNENGIIENEIVTTDNTAVNQPTVDTSTISQTNTTAQTTPEVNNSGVIENQVVTEEYVNNSDLPIIEANGDNSGVINNVDIKF